MSLMFYHFACFKRCHIVGSWLNFDLNTFVYVESENEKSMSPKKKCVNLINVTGIFVSLDGIYLLVINISI